MTSLLTPMRAAQALVREGRLGEATALIQGALSRAAPEGGDGDGRPMRDVTPRAAALAPPGAPPSGGASAAGRGAGRDPAERGGAGSGGAGAGAPAERGARGRLDGRAAPFVPAAMARREGFAAGLMDRLERRVGGGRLRTRAASGSRAPIPEGARFEERRHEGPHGALSYKLYAPAHRVASPPLLVMLHGCTQDPDDFALGTRMNALAEETGALVAYPRQPAEANPNRCWNWFEPAHTGRSGEAARIAGIAADVVRDEGCDAGRVFAAGLSAGGAMAAALGASHPKVFAAVGIHSGLPAGAAHDMPGAFAAMAGRSHAALPIPVPVIAFQGLADRTVAPVNAERIAMAGRPGGGAKPRVLRGTREGRAFERVRLPASGGAGAVELWRVEGLGHAWSGGSGEGSYADPAGPDASRAMMEFFLGGDRS